MHRREFLRTAGGVTGATAAAASAAGPAAATEAGGGGGGGGEPDFGGYLDPVTNFDGVVDRTGQDEVTIQVGVQQGGGPFGFGPAAVKVDNGATVKWEWIGEGGQHNIVSVDDAFESELFTEAGVHFERTFEEDGVFNYFCQPHESLNMKGSVVVGSDFPTTGGGGAATPINPEHMGVPFQAHFVGIATLLAITVSLIFTFFLLKYGESANTKGGNN